LLVCTDARDCWPAEGQQKTVVRVTILNERGERIFSDRDESAKLIEGREDDAAA
jgi:hypothetical protein